MSRFFFHLTDGRQSLEDLVGTELPDIGAARKHVLEHGYDVLARIDPVVGITGEQGAQLDFVPLLGARELFLESWNRAAGESDRVQHWRTWFSAIEPVVAAGYYELEVRSGTFHYSDGFRRVLSLGSAHQPSLKRVMAKFPKPARNALRAAVSRLLDSGARLDLELDLTDAEGAEQVLRVFGVRQYVEGGGEWVTGVCVDVSRLRRLERSAWHASHHDTLTGLPNRALFEDRLDEQISDANGSGRKTGLILLDIDHLRDVNVRLGNKAGDDLLRFVGNRLSELAGGSDRVGRVADDQFGVILPNLASVPQAVSIATATWAALSESSDGDRKTSPTSAGVAVSPDHATYAADLIAGAEIALGIAKSSHSRRIVPLMPKMRKSSQRRLDRLEQVRQALSEDRIFPMYQPKVSLETGRTVGFEALLRWRDHLRGIQLPGSIIEAFEDRELAGRLSARMFGRGLADIKGWQASGVSTGRIGFNASPTEIREQGFSNRVLDRLERIDISPQRIELEVTETALMGDDDGTLVAELRRLKSAGVSIALDDFGTGFGSLTHLRHFPVDVVKIDRSFILEIGTSAQTTEIVTAIISLCNVLGLSVVAEGVESIVQARFLKDAGCAIAQGFLYSKALHATDVPNAAEAIWEVPT